MMHFNNLCRAFVTSCSVLATSPLCMAASAAQHDSSVIEWQLRGLMDARGILTDDTLSWNHRGPGKLRYGGDSSGSGRLLLRGEGAVLVQARLPSDITITNHIAANSQQHDAIDVVESFISYKPAQTSMFAVRAKAGAFIPSISLENTGLAWTSPYTISSSAINSWVGEELRTIGAEGSVVTATESGELTVSAALLGYNDPVGSLLAWRGWAVHDREAGLFDRLPLPRLPNFLPTGSAAGQSDAVRPIAELDDRAGYYVNLGWVGENDVKLRATYYDNRANSLVFDGKQYAWRTKFVSLGVSGSLKNDVEVVAQAMSGNTRMAIFPTFTVVDNDFNSAFILLSRGFGKHRLSTRAEYFEVKDRDFIRDDPNGERGRSFAVAYVYRPNDTQRLTFEVTNVRSVRTARLGLGLPARVNETQAQFSYRYFFSTH
jgi:hypothetical protein